MNKAALGVLLLSLIGVSTFSFGQSGVSEPLKLEATIPMADVQGRIDHLSIDLKGQRLFVAALGNNSLAIVDLKRNKLIHSISGLAEPQGIAYLPSSNRTFVQTAKTVQFERSMRRPGSSEIDSVRRGCRQPPP